jgi:UDP-galactopyranose mutase
MSKKINGFNNSHQVPEKNGHSFSNPSDFDVICFSHLRWDFVYQRPQHLLSRFSKDNRVFFFEEPIFGDTNQFGVTVKSERIFVVVPCIKHGTPGDQIPGILHAFLISLIKSHHIKNYLFWYYDPMAVAFTGDFNPLAIVYDCMDELSLFKGANPALVENEKKLFNAADVVFTGGNSLYEFKKHWHSNIYAFPSSIDKEHFSSGSPDQDPEDQKHIPHPRAGFFGVIDERMDIPLLKGLAQQMTDTHFIIIGPVVKIDPSDLPVAENIHYLGSKPYADLPNYLASWDIAFMPFALNDSTRFISPTKTPEFLAAGIPVVSSPINDVVHPYGEEGLVFIANGVDEFQAAIRKAYQSKNNPIWRAKVDQMLQLNSWNLTWNKMREKILGAIKNNNQAEETTTETFSEWFKNDNKKISNQKRLY